MKLSVSFGFFRILVESIKLLPKNGMLMALIALFAIILYSGSSLVFFNCIESLMFDTLVNFMPDPTSFQGHGPVSFTPKTGSMSPPLVHPQTTGFMSPPLLNPRLKKDLALIATVEITFLLAVFVIIFLSWISTIIVSAASYANKSLSFKDFFTCIWRTWKRPFITTLYTTTLIIAYVVVSFTFVTPLVIYSTTVTIAPAVIVGIGAFVLYLYLSVPWALAIVVSVVEETSSGLEALRKAGALLKGKRLHGFLLNVAYVACLLVVQVCQMALKKNWLSRHMRLSVLSRTTVWYLLEFFLVVAYTVLYFHCKKIHGEEVELQETVLYTKLPTTKVGE